VKNGYVLLLHEMLNGPVGAAALRCAPETHKAAPGNPTPPCCPPPSYKTIPPLATAGQPWGVSQCWQTSVGEPQCSAATNPASLPVTAQCCSSSWGSANASKAPARVALRCKVRGGLGWVGWGWHC